jgi:hypothetical protein
VWSFDIYIGIRYRDKVSSEVGKRGGLDEEGWGEIEKGRKRKQRGERGK